MQKFEEINIINGRITVQERCESTGKQYWTRDKIGLRRNNNKNDEFILAVCQTNRK